MTLPAKDSFATYGGFKFDFIDVVDPTTDRSAVEMNTALASLSMMTRMIPQAVVQFDGYAGDPTIYYHEALWGNTSDLKPTVVRGGAGIYQITWPASVIDPLDVTQSVALKTGWVSLEAGGAALAAKITINSNNTASVSTHDAGGAVIDHGAAYKITVFVK